MAATSSIQLKRAYEAATPGDGRRVLVDALWPRGIKKEALPLQVGPPRPTQAAPRQQRPTVGRQGVRGLLPTTQLSCVCPSAAAAPQCADLEQGRGTQHGASQVVSRPCRRVAAVPAALLGGAGGGGLAAAGRGCARGKGAAAEPVCARCAARQSSHFLAADAQAQECNSPTAQVPAGSVALARRLLPRPTSGCS